MARQVRFRVLDGIAVVSLDAPPVNPLSAAMRAGLWHVFDRIASQDGITAAVLRAEGRMFCSGADIRELGQPGTNDAPSLPELFDRIERCPKPVVAALNGQVLGGGAELALACHYRVANRGLSMGFPEIHLGLIPGAGGTQRLPRLAGVSLALDMMLGGQSANADLAYRHNLADAVVDGDLASGALAYTRNLLSEGRGPRPTRDRREVFADGRSDQRSIARLRAQLRGNPIFATHLVVDAIEAATLLPFEAGMAFEADAFSRCLRHPQSVALRHLFMAERRAGPALLDRKGNGFAPTAEGGRPLVLRLRRAMRGAAQALVEAGEASQEAIDAAVVAFGFRKGPFGGREAGVPSDRLMRPLLGALVSEGAACLEEGLVARPSDIDALAVHGLGFPRREGGPFRSVQSLGLVSFLADMRSWSEDNLIWEPPELLIEAVKEAAGFDRFN